jgi:hypothetical protein
VQFGGFVRVDAFRVEQGIDLDFIKRSPEIERVFRDVQKHLVVILSDEEKSVTRFYGLQFRRQWL